MRSLRSFAGSTICSQSSRHGRFVALTPVLRIWKRSETAIRSAAVSALTKTMN